MDNSRAAVETLKRALKLNGYTYADVAAHLKLSEASIKKMFASNHFTLKRIDDICAMMGMDFIDLVRLFDQSRQRISNLTPEQEKELVGDGKLLLVALLARNRWSFEEMIHHFDLTRGELLKLLSRLEKLHLLELHPGNRIRMLVDDNFRWLPHGPIEQLFEKHLMSQFLNGKFDGRNELRLYLHGPLTPGAMEQLRRRLDTLAHEFSELLKESSSRPIRERQNIGLLLASRKWEPGFLQRYRRKKEA